MDVILLLVLFLNECSTAPIATFPVNAQVPPVARVAQPFSFQFAATTFTSATSTSALNYRLQDDAPSWLLMDSATRTFYGTPLGADLGSCVFSMDAEDDTGGATMSVTFVVVDSSVPMMMGNTSAELAQYGQLSGPTTLALYTGSSFAVEFPSTMFTELIDPIYYATCEDRSPLPSWMTFDAATLKFSGSTPPLLSSPQVYGFTLFVSRVGGFEEAALDFSFEVSNHRLAFQTEQQTVHIASNAAFNFTIPKSQLLLDGQKIPEEDIALTGAHTPPWLDFDSETFSFSGQAPANTTSQQVSVLATDIYGDEAVALVIFEFGTSLFAGTIGTISAIAGRFFSYAFSQSLFTSENIIANVTFADAGTWLHFDNNNLTLQGVVPSTLSPGILRGVLHVHSGSTSASDSQSFDIRILAATSPANGTASPTSPAALTSQSSTSSSASTALPGTSSAITSSAVGTASTATDPLPSAHSSLSKTANIIIGVIITVAILLLASALILCLRHKRRNKHHRISKSTIWPESFLARQWHRRRHDDLEKDHSFISGPYTHINPDRPPQLEDEILGFFSTFGSSARSRDRASAGSILQPADEAALRTINRTSLGTDALGIRVPGKSQPKHTRLLTAPRQPSESLLIRRETLNSRRSSLLEPAATSTSQPHPSRLSDNLTPIHESSPAFHESSPAFHARPIIAPKTRRPNPNLSPTTLPASPTRAWIRRVSRSSTTSQSSTMTRLAPLTHDPRPLAARRQSYINHRASSTGNPLFAAHTAANTLSDRKSALVARGYSGFYSRSRTPLGTLRSFNSRSGGAQRSPFSRSKSSSVGVGAGVMPRHGRSSHAIPSHLADELASEKWETESSVYSERGGTLEDQHGGQHHDEDEDEAADDIDIDSASSDYGDAFGMDAGIRPQRPRKQQRQGQSQRPEKPAEAVSREDKRKMLSHRLGRDSRGALVGAGRRVEEKTAPQAHVQGLRVAPLRTRMSGAGALGGLRAFGEGERDGSSGVFGRMAFL